MPAEPRINSGVITLRPSPAAARSGRTLIVTGVARSGTSMVASVLQRAGLFLGEYVHDVVVEDGQMLELIRTRDMASLRRLIGQRNAAHRSWGFKLPNLHAYLRHEELALFRNPHLILIYRDPVAIAVRSALSEHYDTMRALADANAAHDALAQFSRRADCPVLLLSYEKALVAPHAMIAALLGFCGLRVPDPVRGALVQEVRPNRPEYLAIANSAYEGCIDGLLDGQLQGWCRQLDRLDPVELDVLANGILLQGVRADRFREDLADGGVGNGCHGFALDLVPFRLPAEAVIRVRIRDRVLELSNSGQRLGEYPQLVVRG